MKARDIAQTAKITRVLNKFGFAKLGSGEIVKQMASLVRDHVHMRDLLSACDPSERTNMYEQMRPYLPFRAKSLDEYIADAKHNAEAKQMPTVGPNGNLQPFKPAADVNSIERAAEEAIAAEMAKGTLTVVCSKCTREAQFQSDTIAGATIEARKAGWVYDLLTEKEICPKCPAVRSVQSLRSVHVVLT
jgi:hypothetical protein